jgi:hypothetical protein
VTCSAVTSHNNVACINTLCSSNLRNNLKIWSGGNAIIGIYEALGSNPDWVTSTFIFFGVTKFVQANTKIVHPLSCAVPLAISRRLPIAGRSCGICGAQSGTGAGFLLVLRFPLPLIPSTAPRSSSSVIRGWYNRPNRGRRAKWTQSNSPQKSK